MVTLEVFQQNSILGHIQEMSVDNSTSNTLEHVLTETNYLRQTSLNQIEKNVKQCENIVNNLMQHVEASTKNIPDAQHEKKRKAPDKSPISNGNDTAEQTKPVKTELCETKKSNPKYVLSELRAVIKHRLKHTKPSIIPFFYATVRVDDCIYCGEGISEKIAKTNAAEVALHFLSPSEESSAENNDQNPGMVLNQLCPTTAYTCEEYKIGFKITITIGEYEFSGIGVTTKIAKKAAETEALAKLLVISKNLLADQPLASISDVQKRADYLDSIIHEKLKSLKKTYGNVMTQNGDLPSSEVITEKTAVLTENKPNAQQNKNVQHTTKTELARAKDDKSVSSTNELPPGATYAFEQTGPAQAQNFCATVKIDGCTYHGAENSKEIAETNASNLGMHFVTNNPPKSSPTKPKIKKTKAQHVGVVFNKLYPNALYTCEKQKMVGFKVTIFIGEHRFSSIGASKKGARKAAAAEALAKLLTTSENPDIISAPDDQKRADYIVSLIHEKFKSVMGNFVHNSKVLSGIVMIRNDNLSSCEVITVNTSTKCLSGEHISLSGLTLNDMHAEVLSRRGLVNFFYDQLDLVACSKQNESIFTLRENGKGYKLKDGVEFHLYISDTPCGDASAFCSLFSKRPQGLLRVKDAPGKIILKNRATLQTSTGILEDNLMSMSCSDKICKWNVVGLQGALLSHFIEPIYLKSIILGSLRHQWHLYRAICGRIENQIKNLPNLFQLNTPSLLVSISQAQCVISKTPKVSINWSLSSTKVEVVKSITGKPECGNSQLCKKEFMIRFNNVLGRIFSITEIERKSLKTYREFKKAALPYQAAKECLYEAFVAADLGTWISKPVEQALFQL